MAAGDKIAELDVVRLKTDYVQEGVLAGAKGTVVWLYDKLWCEVEFGNDAETENVVSTIRVSDLEKIKIE